jgi:hypothetical protein
MSLDDEIDDDLRGNCELAMFDDPQDEADYLTGSRGRAREFSRFLHD